jgi:hypothetical protein
MTEIFSDELPELLKEHRAEIAEKQRAYREEHRAEIAEKQRHKERRAKRKEHAEQR